MSVWTLIAIIQRNLGHVRRFFVRTRQHKDPFRQRTASVDTAVRILKIHVFLHALGLSLFAALRMSIANFKTTGSQRAERSILILLLTYYDDDGLWRQLYNKVQTTMATSGVDRIGMVTSLPAFYSNDANCELNDLGINHTGRSVGR